MDSNRISPRIRAITTPANFAEIDQVAKFSSAVELVVAAEELRSGRNGTQQSPDADVQPTDFEVLTDGSLLELVSDRQSRREPRLIHWNSSGSQVTERLEFGGKIFTPLALNPSLIRAVRLPNCVSPSGDTSHMFKRVAEIFGRYLGIPESMLVRVVSWVLATWFPESLVVAPLLWITGPPMSGKTTLITLLSCLCRRPILLTDMTPAGFYTLQDVLKPTLLIDECELSNSSSDRRVMGLIRAGSTRGVQVARRQQIFDCFGPKAIAARLWPEDGALASRAVFVTMLPARQRLPPFDPQLISDEIDTFQSELLHFRMTNFHQVRPPELPEIVDLNPRMLQIARGLAAPLLGEKLLEEQLIDSLRGQDRETDCVRSDEPEYLVLEALFALSHKPQVGELFVQDIANEVNQRLMERGDDRRFKARRIGSFLSSSLGVHTQRLGSWGRGIHISHQHRRQVHRLAQHFGITRREITNWISVKAGYGGPPCELCTEFDLNAGLRYVPIQPVKTYRRRLFEPHHEKADERYDTGHSPGIETEPE